MQVKFKIALWFFLGFAVFVSSCEDFFNPDLGNVLDKDKFFQNWEEYRAAEMGLYVLQQKLVEQIVILGELRADLLEITDNANRDLTEVYNLNISPSNKYASPVNFYKLIGACNNLKNRIERNYPAVLNMNSEITRIDRLYGEVLCMRAWAYWNAVRIYKEIPYIWPALEDISEIEKYVNSSVSFTKNIHINYAPDGFNNDTIRDTTIVLDKTFLNMDAIIDTFTNELENKIKAVGVIHNQDFNDQTWNVTIWNAHARNALLGQMYLYKQNYQKALQYFNLIMYNYESESNNIKFGLDNKFSFNSWRNILTQIDPDEHILSLWFDKASQQTNEFQQLFSIEFPNQYMIKPTGKVIQYWENVWPGMEVDYYDNNPSTTALRKNVDGTHRRGTPGDFYRGYGVSYAYYKNGVRMDDIEIKQMLKNKADNKWNIVKNTMEGVDTVVYKYSIGKNPYDQDPNFMIYRAAAIHLYSADIAIWRLFRDGSGTPQRNVLSSLTIVNNGSYNSNIKQLGVRGRVGMGEGNVALYVRDIVYKHDPYNNEVIGYKRLPTLNEKQYHLEELFLEEHARELAFEGERFYELIRIAKRRGDPSFLAEKVASKFTGSQRDVIRQYLMNEENWYIPLK